MATANIVVVPACDVVSDRHTARGMTFLPNGQQLSCCVPEGEYDVIGECDVRYTELGIPKRGRGVLLVNVTTGEKWYVSVETASMLERHHKRPA